MKRILIAAAILFLVVLLSGAAYIGWLVWQRSNVPFYTFTQQITPDGNFADSYLSSNEVGYVSTRTEFSLELEPTTFGSPLIGQTSDQQEIHAVPGNDDYISYSGFMNPAVIFRKESAPPIELATLPVEEIRYAGDLGGQLVRRTTRDPQLIAEVVEAVQAAPINLPEFSQTYQISLVSPDLPGLVYSIYFAIDSSGTVYFAPLYDARHGFPAGPLFTQWIRQ